MFVYVCVTACVRVCVSVCAHGRVCVCACDRVSVCMCVQVVRALPTMSFFAQLQSKVCLILDAHTRHIWKPFATFFIHNSKTKHNQTKLNSTK